MIVGKHPFNSQNSHEFDDIVMELFSCWKLFLIEIQGIHDYPFFSLKQVVETIIFKWENNSYFARLKKLIIYIKSSVNNGFSIVVNFLL